MTSADAQRGYQDACGRAPPIETSKIDLYARISSTVVIVAYSLLSSAKVS